MCSIEQHDGELTLQIFSPAIKITFKSSTENLELAGGLGVSIARADFFSHHQIDVFVSFRSHLLTYEESNAFLRKS